MPVVSCREMTQMFFLQPPGQGKSSATLCKLFFPREQADTFLCSTEVVQSVIHNPKRNRAIHYCQRKAGNRRDGLEQLQKGSTEHGLALLVQHHPRQGGE